MCYQCPYRTTTHGPLLVLTGRVTEDQVPKYLAFNPATAAEGRGQSCGGSSVARRLPSPSRWPPFGGGVGAVDEQRFVVQKQKQKQGEIKNSGRAEGREGAGQGGGRGARGGGGWQREGERAE